VAFKTQRNGKWLVRWHEGGRGSRQRGKTFATEHEADAFIAEREREAVFAAAPDPFGGAGLAELEWRVENNVWPEQDGPGVPVAEYLRRIIESDASLRPGTRALYLRGVKHRLDGTQLGATPIGAITPEDITSWWNTLPSTPGVRRNAHQLVAKAFNRAVLVGDIPASPMRRAPEVKRPRAGRQEEYDPLTVEQVEHLARAAGEGQWDEYSSARNRLEVLVMAYGGLRGGEVGGLKRTDLVRDASGCRLRVRRQVTRVTGRDAEIADLKTKAAKRDVAIPCSLADEIDDLIERFGTARDGRIFHGRKGALRYGHLVNHSVASAGKAIGLDVNAHQLRHTAVSLLIESGANMVQVQRFVGHANISETLGTYGHLYNEGQQDLADRVEALRENHRNGGASR
jgi:integrase